MNWIVLINCTCGNCLFSVVCILEPNQEWLLSELFQPANVVGEVACVCVCVCLRDTSVNKFMASTKQLVASQGRLAVLRSRSLRCVTQVSPCQFHRSLQQ